eukprot:1158127-Pelagomonas_calceolata.AAC.13
MSQCNSIACLQTSATAYEIDCCIVLKCLTTSSLPSCSSILRCTFKFNSTSRSSTSAGYQTEGAYELSRLYQTIHSDHEVRFDLVMHDSPSMHSTTGCEL